MDERHEQGGGRRQHGGGGHEQAGGGHAQGGGGHEQAGGGHEQGGAGGLGGGAGDAGEGAGAPGNDAGAPGNDVLAALSAAAVRVRQRAGGSVVGIAGGRSVGSGIVVAEGAVLTNAHNAMGPSITVAFADGRGAKGELRAVDPDGDLAVVAVDTKGAAPLAWAAQPPAPGDVVFGAANPGGGGLRVTFGLVSSVDRAFRGPRGRRITGGLEHTAPLPRGASGGPVLDHDGRLVAVNTHRLAEGFYLALPADEALRHRVDALVSGESRSRPRLGVALAPSVAARHLRRAVGLPERDGVLVRAVAEGGPAAAAGIREGDLLVRAGDRDLRSADDLHAVLDRSAPGDVVRIALVRGVEELEVDAVLADAEAA